MSKRSSEIFGEFKPRFLKMKKLAKSSPALALSCLSLETLEKNCGALISSEDEMKKEEIKAEVMGKFEPKFYKGGAYAFMASEDKKEDMEKAVEGPVDPSTTGGAGEWPTATDSIPVAGPN